MPSVYVPQSCVKAIDTRRFVLKRSRAYILREIMDLGLEKWVADEKYRPVHNSEEKQQQVNFSYPTTRANRLSKWASAAGWSKAQLMRFLIMEAILADWLSAIN